MIRHDGAALLGPADAQDEPRIAILVLGCLLTVYDRCIQTIRTTWAARTTSSVDIYYVYGGQNPGPGHDVVDVERLIGQPRPHLQDGAVWVSGDIILCGASDLQSVQSNCVLRKRLLAFGYLANHENYDFVYTVCAGSYVDVEELKRYVRALPRTGVYHGPLNVHGATGYPFVSGSSILLSKDLAGELGRHAEEIWSTYPEDVADDVVIGHWVASRHCSESVDEIRARIGVSPRATSNETFVAPYGGQIMDFVTSPAYSQVPRGPSYHFHFHSRRMLWEMENFHRRFFAAPPGARENG